eukprot:CAMPEP_0114553472 /NCGR_PEP_ID=MMETSP0114-20121206/7681_1 /TAXON_ID=31324 /ORGANISM="Goniomonas sp, Strain m" /LENGTH=254 /DNA_ID=CAMNT_0001738427 /DNA_START=173 /DNA_END=937 /DNA_ORIENTATION=+
MVAKKKAPAPMPAPVVKKSPVMVMVTAALSLVLIVILGSADVLVWSLMWAGFYCLVAQVLQAVVEYPRERLLGYPRWSYYLSIAHQGGSLFIISLVILAAQWGREGWLDAAWGPEHTWEMQVHASIVGAMFKDYWFYGRDFELAFLCHHIMAIAGCSMCTSVPLGVGIVTLNAIQSECVSVFYNVKVIFDSKLARLGFLITMPMSNVLGLYLAYRFANLGVPIQWHATYTLLAIGLTAIRCGGWVLDWMPKSSS